jgi:hypothetical protein
MSKNILLINPWIHDFAAYDFWLKPLGLLYLSGFLRQTGHQVHFIDCLDPYHQAMLARGLKQSQRHAYGRGKFLSNYEADYRKTLIAQHPKPRELIEKLTEEN